MPIRQTTLLFFSPAINNYVSASDLNRSTHEQISQIQFPFMYTTHPPNQVTKNKSSLEKKISNERYGQLQEINCIFRRLPYGADDRESGFFRPFTVGILLTNTYLRLRVFITFLTSLKLHITHRRGPENVRLKGTRLRGKFQFLREARVSFNGAREVSGAHVTPFCYSLKPRLAENVISKFLMIICEGLQRDMLATIYRRGTIRMLHYIIRMLTCLLITRGNIL